jgi:hypothetical protein
MIEMSSYEEVRQLIESLQCAKRAGVRDVKWITDAHVVGVARDSDGRVEVFLRGPQICPISSTVRDAIEFRVVHRDGQPPFDANRLVLPAFGHFDQVAAFVCTELLRSGADAALIPAFSQVEPIIELGIERLRLSRQAVIGLAGELLLIDALCRRATDSQVKEIIAGWDGWRRSSRDLRVNRTGIEVKTTTGAISSHSVEGVHQVELEDGSGGGAVEDRLIMVSIGLQPAVNGGNAFTIPRLVDRIIGRMSEAGLADSVIDTFLFHVAEYGAQSGAGYNHRTQASEPTYRTAFLASFFRAYDMADEAIKVLRKNDLVDYSHVDVSSVSFRVHLPVTASAGNPVSGANQVAAAIIA